MWGLKIRDNHLEPWRNLAMSDVLDRVRDHYQATGLTERLKTALSALGPENQRLTPQQLGGLDQFHTRGLAATAELAKLAGITADMAVLDVGSGVGGPARFLAATYGCRVTGVDLSEPFVEAARYLTERTGQSGQVSFQTGSALELPFDDGRFNLVLLQHVAMNISDRARLYREIRRVLKSGGRFATFDVVLNSWCGKTTPRPPRRGSPSCARRGRPRPQISAWSWGRTSRSLPPTWGEISWKAGSASSLRSSSPRESTPDRCSKCRRESCS
jgi:SAM-dependent methyltransferase